VPPRKIDFFKDKKIFKEKFRNSNYTLKKSRDGGYGMAQKNRSTPLRNIYERLLKREDYENINV